MSGISKLIFKNWYKYFFGAIAILVLLITVANLIAGFLRGNVTAIDVIKNHIIEMPGYINQILPVSCLVASLFAINKLKTRSELTAIFASGYSRAQFTLVIIVASGVVGLFQFITTSYIDPIAKKNRNIILEDGEEKFRNLKGAGLRTATIGSGSVWYKSKNYYFSFDAFDKEKLQLKNINIYFYDQNYHIAGHISAETAEYLSGTSWKLTNAKKSSNLNLISYPLIEKFSETTLSINETPQDFDKIEADTTTLNVQQLYQYISRLEKSGINTNQYRVLFYDKFALSLLCVIFAILSSVSIFNPNRRSSSFGKNIMFVLAFTLIYWVISSYLTDLGKYSKVPPIFSSFFVPFIFSLYLCFYFYHHRKLR